MVTDATEDISEPGARIDVIQAGGDDQGIYRGGPLPHRDQIRRTARPSALGRYHEVRVPRHCCSANAAIAEEATEALLSLQNVVHSFGNIGVAREFGTCRAHPVFELGDKRCDPGLAKGVALIGGLAVDFPLCREDRVDPPHGFDCEWRLAQFRELEEFAARMGPASCLGDRTRLARRVIETVEPGIGVGLQDAPPPREMPERTGGRTVRRIVEQGRRPGIAAEGSVVPHVGP